MIHKIQLIRDKILDAMPQCIINNQEYEAESKGRDLSIKHISEIKREAGLYFIGGVPIGEISYSNLISTIVKIGTEPNIIRLEKSRLSPIGTINGKAKGRYFETKKGNPKYIGLCRKEQDIPYILVLIMEMYWQDNFT